MKHTTHNNHMPLSSRLAMVNWLLLPLILVVIVVIYAIGITHKPRWEDPISITSGANALGAAPTIVPLRWNGEGLVTFWFDDGWLSQYQVALPALERHAWVGSIAVTTDLVGYDAYVTWPQITRLEYKGWEITPHSRTHKCEPDRLTAQGLKDEVVGSKQIISSRNLQSDVYVLPCGAINPELVSVVKDNYLGMRTSEYGVNPLPVQNPYYIYANALKVTHTDSDVQSWIDDTKQKKGWLVLMFHQIDRGGDEYSVTPEFYEKILDLVDQSGLKVVLPSQALNVSISDLTPAVKSPEVSL